MTTETNLLEQDFGYIEDSILGISEPEREAFSLLEKKLFEEELARIQKVIADDPALSELSSLLPSSKDSASDLASVNYFEFGIKVDYNQITKRRGLLLFTLPRAIKIGNEYCGFLGEFESAHKTLLPNPGNIKIYSGDFYGDPKRIIELKDVYFKLTIVYQQSVFLEFYKDEKKNDKIALLKGIISKPIYQGVKFFGKGVFLK